MNPTPFFSFLVAFIAKGGVFKGLPAENKERKKGKVMGKWGDESLHGRRKGKVMGEKAEGG